MPVPCRYLYTRKLQNIIIHVWSTHRTHTLNQSPNKEAMTNSNFEEESEYTVGHRREPTFPNSGKFNTQLFLIIGPFLISFANHITLG